MFNDFISNLRKTTQEQAHKPNFAAFPSTSKSMANRATNALRRGEGSNSFFTDDYLYGARWLGNSRGDYSSPEYFSRTGNVSDKIPSRKAKVRSRDNWYNPLDMSISYDDDGTISQIEVSGADDYYKKMGIENKVYRGASAISNLFRHMELDAVQYSAQDRTDENNTNPPSVWFGANSELYAPANVFGSNGVLFGTGKTKDSNDYDTRDWSYGRSGQFSEYLKRYNDKFAENWRKSHR